MRTRAFAAAGLLLLLGACQDTPLTPDSPKGPSVDIPHPTGELRTGWIYGPDGNPMEVTFVVFEGWAIFEGDINLGRADEIAKTREELARSGGPRYGVYINGSSYRWPSGVVPYVIDSSFSWWEHQNILAGIDSVASRVGGVRFKAKTNETSYVVFSKHPSACNSHVGRQSTYLPQTINLTAGCAGVPGIVAHEILHALGMWHEHSRCDRDSYITINLNNVHSTNHHAFDKKCSGNTSVFAYNEGSVMHYGTHAFSSNGGQVISSKRGLDHLMGQRSGLAQSDASTINWIYAPYPPQNISTTNQGGYAHTTWTPSGGATHYSVSYVEVYEYYNNWTGQSWSSENSFGGGIVYQPAFTGNAYTGNSTCLIYDSGWETEQYTYWYDLRAHFPDGISSSIIRWPAPVGPC